MTNQELINYYANLLILEYLGQTNAYATIQALVAPVIMNQLPLAVQNAFNMDGTAVGVQLDVLGKYAGVTRNGYGLQGQPISLNDTDFFKFIQLAVLTNSAGSDLNTIQALIEIYFPGELFVFDHKEMRMSYLINSTVGSQNLVQLFITEETLPKPMGVQLAAPIYSSNLKFFGMVSARDVAAYAAQNSLSIAAAANAVAAANNIWQFNSASGTRVSGTWLSAQLGVAL
jgi:hypothetical protein